MLLHIFIMLRSSQDIKSLPSKSQYHICKLAVDYINTHATGLDQPYFDNFTRQLYFPEDAKHAGTIAIDLLKIIKETGWCSRCKYDFSIEDVCTVALSKYLAVKNDGPDFQTIIGFADKLPMGVIKCLLAETVCATRKRLTGKIYNVSCKIMVDWFGAPVGSNADISLNRLDSVNFIKYLVGRKTNGSFNVVQGRSKNRIFCNGSELSGRQVVSECSITSGTVLEIK